MFCPACGASVQQNLSYCNRCGAKVGGAPAEGAGRSAELSPNLILAVIGVVFAVGLGSFLSLLALMKQGDGINPIIFVGAGLSFLAMIVLEAVLLWLLLRGRKSAPRASVAAPPNEQTTRELAEAQARLLPDPLPSVTEQTTRAFEPLPRARKSP